MLKLNYIPGAVEAGCDEAGRGCLSGPVVAAAVILPPNFHNNFIDDSKKLNEKKRNELKEVIKKESLAWGIGYVSPKEIDDINILNASFLAMHRAIDQLSIKPELLLIDGNKFNQYQNIKHHCIIKGDSKFLSIAAASILAKTSRDKYMNELDQIYPEYDWKNNKGYPTAKHRAAISKIGHTEHHRKSFQLLPPQLKFNF
ncbi:MAG: ribonuclease HII [Flavobacteriales bacterium]